jgi:hypothetical protein
LLLCCLAESQALRGAGDPGAAGAARAVQRRAQDLAKEAGAGPESELGLALAQLERRLAGAITPS